MRTPAEEIEQTGFDMRVTIRDPKTGLVVKRNPYTLRVCSKEGGGTTRYYERPVGSGNLFDKRGNPIGRWDATKPEGERFIKGAEHVAFVRPQTEDEKLAAAVIAREQENAILRAEIAAMKAEAAKKSQPSRSDKKSQES